jgi:hypothetical protein
MKGRGKGNRGMRVNARDMLAAVTRRVTIFPVASEAWGSAIIEMPMSSTTLYMDYIITCVLRWRRVITAPTS